MELVGGIEAAAVGTLNANRSAMNGIQEVVGSIPISSTR
jgi:hypothetical protein